MTHDPQEKGTKHTFSVPHYPYLEIVVTKKQPITSLYEGWWVVLYKSILKILQNHKPTSLSLMQDRQMIFDRYVHQ